MIAYWIAFGPHGPRAQAPKGEGLRIFFKVVQLVSASCAVFYVIHLFGKPLPRTMTKEYQEASNEYARVCILLCPLDWIMLMANSKNVSTPSTVSAKRDTRARASSRAPRPRRSKLDGHENEEQVLRLSDDMLDEQFFSLLAVYPVALTYATTTTTKDPRCWSGIFSFPSQGVRKSVYFVLCNNRLYFFCSHRALHYVSDVRVVLVWKLVVV